MSAKNEYLKNVQGRYFCGKDGTAYYQEPLKSENGVYTDSFMNFWPELVELKQTDDGFSVRDFITFRAFRDGRYEASVDLEKKDMIGNQPHAKFSPGCRIFRGSGNIGRCSELMAMQCETAKTKRVYAHTGWKIIDGERVFLNGGYSVTADGLTDRYCVELAPDLARCYRFIEAPEEGCFDTVMSLYQAAPDWLVVPSLAYVFLSPLNEMLRDRGEEPCFTFYLIGKTGSYKSSWAKILLAFFGKLGYAETAPITFQDTQNAIGYKLALGADVPLLLDDRRPTNNTADKAQYEGKEKFVSSAIGDRAARGRLNADGSAKVSTVARCNLIVTAEEAFQNIGSSAIARSLSVELEPHTVNFDRLRDLQNNAAALNKSMQLYLQWVIKHYEEIRDKSEGRLRGFRDYFAEAGHPRLATACSQMMLGYCQFLRFLKDQEQIQEKQEKEMAEQALKIFLEMCERQGAKVESEKPTVLFIKLLSEMLETKQARLCDLRTFTASGAWLYRDFIGYRDGEYIYLIGQTAYNAVVQFCARGGNTFPASAPALWKMFKDEGKLFPDTGGKRLDRKKRIGDKQGRYIWLTASLLNDEKEE